MLSRINKNNVKQAAEQVWADHPTLKEMELPSFTAHVLDIIFHDGYGAIFEERYRNAIEEVLIQLDYVCYYTTTQSPYLRVRTEYICRHGYDPPSYIPHTAEVDPSCPVCNTSPKENLVNDYVCPGCGNDRVSKCEQTCWKCGGNLH